MDTQKDERDPRITEAIRWMKQEIKRLAAWQIECKKARKLKMVELTPEIREKFGLGQWCSGTQAVVVRNKGHITALLNLYLSARGKEYRHNVSDGTAYYYAQKEKELLAKFPELDQLNSAA